MRVLPSQASEPLVGVSCPHRRDLYRTRELNPTKTDYDSAPFIRLAVRHFQVLRSFDYAPVTVPHGGGQS